MQGTFFAFIDFSDQILNAPQAPECSRKLKYKSDLFQTISKKMGIDPINPDDDPDKKRESRSRFDSTWFEYRMALTMLKRKGFPKILKGDTFGQSGNVCRNCSLRPKNTATKYL